MYRDWLDRCQSSFCKREIAVNFHYLGRPFSSKKPRHSHSKMHLKTDVVNIIYRTVRRFTKYKNLTQFCIWVEGLDRIPILTTLLSASGILPRQPDSIPAQILHDHLIARNVTAANNCNDSIKALSIDTIPLLAKSLSFKATPRSFHIPHNPQHVVNGINRYNQRRHTVLDRARIRNAFRNWVISGQPFTEPESPAFWRFWQLHD